MLSGVKNTLDSPVCGAPAGTPISDARRVPTNPRRWHQRHQRRQRCPPAPSSSGTSASEIDALSSKGSRGPDYLTRSIALRLARIKSLDIL